MSSQHDNILIKDISSLEKLKCLSDNAMLKVRSELWIEWDFEKNDELGFDIWKMTKGSHKIVNWICKSCSSKHSLSVSDKVRSKSNCPYCSGQRVNDTNSLFTLNPKLASEWHPTKNGNLTPNDVTCGSNKKLWWLGECGHEWESRLSSRHLDCLGCPYCTNQKTLIGFNDIHTTNALMSSSLVNFDDGFKYTQGSNKSIEFKCNECNYIIGKRKIIDIFTYGLSCPKCSDGKSYPEKFMSNLLSELNIEFMNDVVFEWSENRRYDFYIPSLNLIIETHGGQHYNGQFKSLGGRNLIDEEKNDLIKRNLALNNVEGYIELDCRYSDFKYIKNIIIQSELKNHIDLSNVDFDVVNGKSLKSLVMLISKEYNDSLETIKELAKKHKLSPKTVRSYVEKGYELGITKYKQDKEKISDICNKHNYREVVKLSKDGVFIESYKSMKSAAMEFENKKINTVITSISSCCKNRIPTAYGYKWMYKKDYDKLIN